VALALSRGSLSDGRLALRKPLGTLATAVLDSPGVLAAGLRAVPLVAAFRE
jgi:hypothetical protein